MMSLMGLDFFISSIFSLILALMSKMVKIRRAFIILSAATAESALPLWLCVCSVFYSSSHVMT